MFLQILPHHSHFISVQNSFSSLRPFEWKSWIVGWRTCCADIKAAGHTLRTGTRDRPRTLKSARRCRVAWSDDSQPQPPSIHDDRPPPSSSSSIIPPRSVIPILITHTTSSRESDSEPQSPMTTDFEPDRDFQPDDTFDPMTSSVDLRDGRTDDVDSVTDNVFFVSPYDARI